MDGGSDNGVDFLNAACGFLTGAGKVAHLLRDDGKASAGRACVGSLHGGIEGDELGLLGDGENLACQGLNLVNTVAFCDGVI